MKYVPTVTRAPQKSGCRPCELAVSTHMSTEFPRPPSRATRSHEFRAHVTSEATEVHSSRLHGSRCISLHSYSTPGGGDADVIKATPAPKMFAVWGTGWGLMKSQPLGMMR